MADCKEEKCCGTCTWHKPSWKTGHLQGYHCTNEESEGYGLQTDYEDECMDWEEK